jgi:WD40 repeat protein
MREVVECFRREDRSFLTPFKGTLEDDTEIDVTHECLLRKWDTLRDDWGTKTEVIKAGTIGRIAFDPSSADSLMAAKADGNLCSFSYAQDLGETHSPAPCNSVLKLGSPITDFSVQHAGSQIAVSTKSGVGKLWSVSRGTEVARLITDSSMQAISWSDTAQQAAAVTVDGSVYRWRSDPIENGIKISSIFSRLSPDLKLVFTVTPTMRAQLLETTTGKLLQSWLLLSPNALYPVQWSPDQHLIIERSASAALPDSVPLEVHTFQDGLIGPKIWGIQGITLVARAFSPDSSYIAGRDGEHLFVWKAQTGEKVRSWALSEPASSFTFSRDSKSLFVSSGLSIKCFRLDTGTSEPVKWMSGRRNARIYFTPDGKRVALLDSHGIGDSDEEEGAARTSVLVFEYPTERELHTFDLPAAVGAMAFSADSRYALISASDRIVRIWDLQSGTEVARIPLSSHASALGFTKDLRIAIADSEHFAYYSWKPHDLIQELCQKVSRNLTKAEWRHYGSGEPYQKVCPGLP